MQPISHFRTEHAKQRLFIESTAKRKVIRAGRRGGKAQPLTAKVYTPSGPILMGDISIGDKVLTPSGTVVRVENIFPQGYVDIYKMSFGDGTSVECTEDHLWEIHEKRTDSNWKERNRVLTTRDIKLLSTLYGTNRRPTIPKTEPVNYNKQEISIDPYLLGVLVGDGTMRHESVLVSSEDGYIVNRVGEALPEGVSVKRDRNTCDYRLSTRCGGVYNPLIRSLKDLGLWGKYSYQKFIPDVYKYNTIDIRLEVIRGLLDTDGSVDHNGQPRFEQTSKRLSEDFAELVQSIGGLCTTNTRMGGYKVNGIKKETRIVYRQTVLYDNAKELFNLPRKKNKTRMRAREAKRYIKSIEYSRKDFAQCIQISGKRGLYLTDNLTATHNTVGISILGAEYFAIKKKRVLYGAPTQDQVDRFWHEICMTFAEHIDAGYIYKNETKHILEIPNSEIRIRAKTCWSADTLRGDYADLLILDEWQLMNEDAWELVGAPMLLDNDGDAVFIYTPPSIRTRSITKAYDPMHAAKLFRKAAKDTTGRWETFHFTSHDNPHISTKALADISGDMTAVAIRQEIMAEDIDEYPGALWTRNLLEKNRVDFDDIPEMKRIVVGVDPQGKKKDNAETGIIVAGLGKDGKGYLLADNSINARPKEWGGQVCKSYHTWESDRVVAEVNYGGEMVEAVIAQSDPAVPVKMVNASRGKIIRAEPISALAEKGKIKHAGDFPKVEDEMCTFTQDSNFSPNRLDAYVWAFTELMLKGHGNWGALFASSEREGEKVL